MRRMIGTFTMLVLVLGAGVGAGERVLDTLTDLLRGTQQVRDTASPSSTPTVS